MRENDIVYTVHDVPYMLRVSGKGKMRIYGFFWVAVEGCEPLLEVVASLSDVVIGTCCVKA